MLRIGLSQPMLCFFRSEHPRHLGLGRQAPGKLQSQLNILKHSERVPQLLCTHLP